jgi:signal transduction histidine kinase
MHPSNWITHVHPDDAAEIAEAWKQVFQGFQQITSEFRWVRRDREIHTTGEEDVTWCTMAAAPELDDEGNLVRVFGVIADISERKRVETIQRQRLEEANESRRQQENFIDMISHEVRTPSPLVFRFNGRCEIHCRRCCNRRIRCCSV